MKTTKRKPPLVEVEWIDSCSPGRKWHDIEAMKGYTPSKATSVGWLMEKRKDAIVIAASIGDGEGGDWTAIPRSVVRRIRRLR